MIDQQYYIITIFVIVAISFLSTSLINLEKNRIYGFSLYIILLLLVVFRPCSMSDYENYKNSFLVSYDIRFEPIFGAVKYVVKQFENPAFWGIATFAFLSVSIRLLFVYKCSSSLFASLLVYISNVYIAQDMIAIRAALATAFLLPSLYYKANGDKYKFIIFLLLAVLSHYSACLFFILLFVSSQKAYANYYFILLLISFILTFFGVTFGQYLSMIGIMQIQSAAEIYMNQKGINIFNLLQIGRIIVCCFCWFIHREYTNKGENIDGFATLLLKVYTLGLCFAFLFSDLISISVRSSELFFSVEILMVPYYFSKGFRNPIIYKTILLTYASIILYISIHDIAYWPNLK